MERLLYARISKTSTGAEVAFETAEPTASKCAALYLDGKIISTAVISLSAENACMGVAKFAVKTIDVTARYAFALENGGSVAADTSKLIDTAEFIKRYENADTQAVRLGATCAKDKTEFRLWAPFAKSVKLKLYAGSTTEKAQILPMEKRLDSRGEFGGVWQKTTDGDRHGEYYNYIVNNYGKATETIDPYAKACAANGIRGMAVNLQATNPPGWENDKILALTNPEAADSPIIWEVSVKDFSASADSGMAYKGKFKAFAETGTTVPGTALKTGVDYLKELGVTYVHLNPVFDFATVDEADGNRADSSDSYNWGYDPQNYNAPEGSYATVADGTARITEFKQAVMALHAAGIGVIIDVVYNHTYATGGQALNDTAPLYYHRTDERGAFTNDSGCGNGTASERTMTRKYIVESVLYWAKEYHVDGFRFDLMGIHDTVTLNTVRAELDKLWSGAGKKILIYGEPWSADGDYIPASYVARINATKKHIAGTGKFTDNADTKLIKQAFIDGFSSETAFDGLSPRIAVFNGSGRDGLRGACFDKTPGVGWVNGAPAEVFKVKRMIEGGIGGFADGLNVGTGSRNVAYAAAHDNYTLWDHIRGAKHGDASPLFYDDPNAECVKRCMLVSAAYMMSTGMCFMLAGEEFARTKYGNEDSYNSPTKLNCLQWSRRREFPKLFEHYKKLIALRKKYAEQLFSYERSVEKAYAYGHFDEADGETGRIVFRRENAGVKLVLELDPAALRGKITIGEDEYVF